MVFDRDYVLCEGALDRLIQLVEGLETQYEITVTSSPAICLTMLQAEDSVEHQPFFLGEALTTECEVAIQGITGFGVVLEDQPQRAYCLAVIDALEKIYDHNWPAIEAFLQAEYVYLMEQEAAAANRILHSTVDFKLMEEA
jgi:alpha-D-ribose 1-methylphosphonate 5-triphosphate synthase subunit PhnG